jgi:DNA-binding beta-propeller fold protein YncE
MMRTLSSLILGALVSVSVTAADAQSAPPRAGAESSGPTQDYLLLVVAESADQVALVRFGPGGAKIERSHRVGMMPTEINGPHGIAASPDGKYYYVTIAHGTPYGTLWKFTTDKDSLVGRTTLGLFPASIQTTPDGSLAFVVNFNLHGDMVPSSVSIVSTEEMLEIARTTTCTMPHGSRVNAKGTHQYSTCMMDDMLVEIDTHTFGVSRHFMLAAGKEHGEKGAPQSGHHAAPGGHAGGHHDSAAAKMPEVHCSPTWAQPSASGDRIFVACNKSNDIVEVDFESWQLKRRIPAGNGVYNLAVSPDGKVLIGTNKRAQSITVFDIASGKATATIPTKRKVVHGVVVSPDSRYAFVTQEGTGSEPGTLEVFDLRTMKSVATVDLGQQAAGLDFLRTEPAKQ